MNIHENKLVDYGVLFQQMQKQLSYRMLLLDLISWGPLIKWQSSAWSRVKCLPCGKSQNLLTFFITFIWSNKSTYYIFSVWLVYHTLKKTIQVNLNNDLGQQHISVDNCTLWWYLVEKTKQVSNQLANKDGKRASLCSHYTYVEIVIL